MQAAASCQHPISQRAYRNTRKITLGAYPVAFILLLAIKQKIEDCRTTPSLPCVSFTVEIKCWGTLILWKGIPFDCFLSYYEATPDS